jgi:hypothetical protein
MLAYEPICEAERRLGLEYVNIAARGVKAHPGRRVSDRTSLVLFDKPKTGEMIAALWSMERHEAITSETLLFGLGMLWDWDWRAEAVQAAFDRLAPAISAEPEAASLAVSL